jgi:hypothetical protein
MQKGQDVLLLSAKGLGMKRFNSLKALFGFVVFFTVAGPAGAEQVIPNGMKLDGGIQQLLLKKTLKELQRDYPSRIISIKNIPQESGTLTRIGFSLYGGVLVLGSWGQGVTRIQTTDSRYKTRSGGRTGQTLREIVRSHPKGKLYFGASYPPHFPGNSMNYQIDNGHVIFILSTSGIPTKRFESKNISIDQKDVLDSRVKEILIEFEQI